MTPQLIKGLGSEAIPACFLLANQRLRKQCYPSMQCSQNTSYKRAWKAKKDEEGEGRDFSGSLVQAIGKPLSIPTKKQLETSPVP